MIDEIDDFEEFMGERVLPIDDNNQYPTFQFRDNNGWKNFCTGHANELKMTYMKGHKIKKMPSFYTDSNTGRTAKTNIEIDLKKKTQQGRTTRTIRAVWVTPILQIGQRNIPILAIREPEWSDNGPRIPGIGPPHGARSHQQEGGNGAAASGSSAAPADAGT